MKPSVLVLGAGNSRDSKVCAEEPYALRFKPFSECFREVVTIDQDPFCKPDILWDLERIPWPVAEGYFDEVHAYEVLEHLGTLGDYERFFELWKQIWRVLKPGGFVCASTPWWNSVWAFQDPGHRMVYSASLLTYLNQKEYMSQVGRTPMTDYRRVYPPPYSFQLMWDSPTSGAPKVNPLNFPAEPPAGLEDVYDKLKRLNQGLEGLWQCFSAGYVFVLRKDVMGDS